MDTRERRRDAPTLLVLSTEAVDRLWPEARRIRIQTEHDAAAALLHERRKPVGEMQPQAPGQGLRPIEASALDRFLQARAGAEARHLARGDLDLLAGLGVHAFAGAPVGDRELAEAGEAHLAPARERLLNRVE